MNQIETFKANRRDKQSNIIRETCSQLAEQVCCAKILFELDFNDNDLFILRNMAQLPILELQNNFRYVISIMDILDYKTSMFFKPLGMFRYVSLFVLD